ncbi:hypothetical protein OIO90_005805 [Microbotryomycetes sp. JL221]|nr:hypothetical protein OIO90_005805 [Microbotryomycetes sp. JL221]
MPAGGLSFTDIDLTDTYADEHSSYCSDHDERQQQDDVHRHDDARDHSTLMRQRLQQQRQLSVDGTSVDTSFETTTRLNFNHHDQQTSQGRTRQRDVDKLMAFVDDHLPHNNNNNNHSTRHHDHVRRQLDEPTLTESQTNDLTAQVESRRRLDQVELAREPRSWDDTALRNLSIHRSSPPSRTAPTDVPVDDEALQEFSRIVSQRTSPVSNQSRPRSRMRQFPSPPNFQQHGSTSTQTLPQHRHEADESQSNEDDTSRFTEPDLIDELQHARSYIAHLQQQLRSINGMVNEMKSSRLSSTSQVDDPIRVLPARFPPPPPPPQVGSVAASDEETLLGDETLRHAERGVNVDRGENEAVLNVAKHILSLVPSLHDLPSIESLSLALDLTRALDSRVHDSNSRRRDQDIFTKDNIGMLIKSVDEWRRASASAIGETTG